MEEKDKTKKSKENQRKARRGGHGGKIKPDRHRQTYRANSISEEEWEVRVGGNGQIEACFILLFSFFFRVITARSGPSSRLQFAVGHVMRCRWNEWIKLGYCWRRCILLSSWCLVSNRCCCCLLLFDKLIWLPSICTWLLSELSHRECFFFFLLLFSFFGKCIKIRHFKELGSVTDKHRSRWNQWLILFSKIETVCELQNRCTRKDRANRDRQQSRKTSPQNRTKIKWSEDGVNERFFVWTIFLFRSQWIIITHTWYFVRDMLAGRNLDRLETRIPPELLRSSKQEFHPQRQSESAEWEKIEEREDTSNSR